MTVRGENVSGAKVRILSDLHLGHPASLVGDVEELRPLLEGVDTVVFNGDTCELDYGEWTEAGEEWVADLGKLCGDVGVRPVFLTGNHDSNISEQGWLDLLGGAVFVTHGDMVHRVVAPWSREYLARKREVAAAWAERTENPADLRSRWEGVRAVEDILRKRMPAKLRLRGKWQLLSALWPPGRPPAILWAWATRFSFAHGFLQRYRPEARVMIFGHFHRPGVAWRDACLYINTGAFVTGSSGYVVDLEGDRMEVRVVRRNGGGGFAPGDPVGIFRIA